MLQQYDRVRSELDEAVKETRTLERYAILVTGGIWGWVLSHDVTDIAHIALWLPFIITLFFWVRAWSLKVHINRISGFLKNIEDFFCVTKDTGWEKYLECHPSKIQVSSALLFWGGLTFITLLLPWLVICTH